MVATNILKPSLPNINMVKKNTCGLDSCVFFGVVEIHEKNTGKLIIGLLLISTAIWSNEIATSHGSLTSKGSV